MIDQESSPDTRPRAKILIVDDHPVVREGLLRRINRQPDLVVCGEVGAAAEAMKAIAAGRPDLAIVDLTLQDKSGLELIKDIQTRYPRLPVLSYPCTTRRSMRRVRCGQAPGATS
jgi:DNA-binding NarL/FixJ family response regulator